MYSMHWPLLEAAELVPYSTYSTCSCKYVLYL